ncbi:YppG family protein [Fredinandcohnia sp. QZ13]|uniref:YppG family protein n=1 Tax=Fredinandcohnia sp. QZ13 TaxID=3073144 RepID=UPI0028536E28|nr:YppG family protein [Fredinandcohnia sp. QZ13]MDR4888672.1 YppG family protein [Fredinandcohnia sp. QZ13]
MYQSFGRNKALRPYGYSWPFYDQATYQQFYGGGNQSQWNPNYPPSYMHYNINSYPGFSSSGYQTPQTPYPTPYPIGMEQAQKKGGGGILTQFKKDDGTYDINKMMDTAGQMVGTINQVNSIVKGLTKTFKV